MLRDPVWQFVGVIVSIAALLVAIAAIRFQLVRKSLSYYHSIDNPAFFVINRELRERLHITFDEREVQQLSTFDLCIFNNGNAAILPGDFIQPISVEFAASSHIFGVLTTETSPSNLAVKITRNETRFVVDPLLLNPGDQFTLQFLVEHPTDSYLLSPTVEGRVAGVKTFGPRPFRFGARHRFGYYFFRTYGLVVPAVALLMGVFIGLFSNWVFSLLRTLVTRLVGEG